MSTSLAAQDERCTWTHYRSWPDDKRWQIIDGDAYALSAAPATRHQKLQSRLTAAFEGFLHGKPCDVYPAPTDLKLSETDVVQPDLMVVCDQEQVKVTHIEGPPTLVVEILSPSTESLDRGRKLDLYARSGVAEVWLVRPYPALLEIYLLDSDVYRRHSAFSRKDTFRSPTFPELELDLDALFDLPVSREEKIDMVREGRPPYPSPAPGTSTTGT